MSNYIHCKYHLKFPQFYATPSLWFLINNSFDFSLYHFRSASVQKTSFNEVYCFGSLFQLMALFALPFALYCAINSAKQETITVVICWLGMVVKR